MLSRRHFLGASLVTTVYAAGSFVPVWAKNAPNFGTPTLPSPGFRRMKVGDVEVIALNDGITRRPLGEEFVKNAPLAEVRALLASQGLPTDYIDVPYTPFLVVAGARIEDLGPDSITLRVTAPHAGGAANAACRAFLADVLGVARSRILLACGGTARKKLLRIRDADVASVFGRLTSRK